MASFSGICPSSPALKCKILLRRATISPVSFRSKVIDRRLGLGWNQSMSSTDGHLTEEKKGLEKDSRALWRRYVDWLYRHKKLGLFLDVSRIGYTDVFVKQMEPVSMPLFLAWRTRGREQSPIPMRVAWLDIIG